MLTEPTGNPARIPRQSAYVDQSLTCSIFEALIAHPDSGKSTKVRKNLNIDAHGGIGETDINVSAIVDDPVEPFARGHRLELELDDDSIVAEAARTQIPPDVPKEYLGIKFIGAILTPSPALTPFSQPLDDRQQLGACISQYIGSSRRVMLDNTCRLELLEAFRQKARRAGWDPAADLVEAGAANQHLAKDQRCPSLAHHLSSLGDRAERPITG
jgi:hypothetical protein